MPEEIFETPQPTQPTAENKTTNRPKIILVAVLGLGLLAGSAYAGYWYGTESANLKTQSEKLTSAVSRPTTKTTPTPTPMIEDETKNWKTYTNTEYGYAVKYPDGWEYLEVPNQTYQSLIDQTWFSNVGWPPPQTGARAPIVINYSEENPEIHYQPEFYENYKRESIIIGNSLFAVRISGRNKEGLMNEAVVILPVKGKNYNYLSFLPWSGLGEDQDFDTIFDQILSTFRFLPSMME